MINNCNRQISAKQIRETNEIAALASEIPSCVREKILYMMQGVVLMNNLEGNGDTAALNSQQNKDKQAV